MIKHVNGMRAVSERFFGRRRWIDLLVLSCWVLVAASGCSVPNPAFGTGARGDADVVGDGQRESSGADALGTADARNADPADAAAACGEGIPNVATISGADGLAVAPDGTLFFSASDATDGWIGRVLPGGSPEPRWLRVEQARIITGLAFDSARNRLYVGSVSASAIMAFQLGTANPSPSTVRGSLVDINDVTLDREGNLYYSLQADGHVHRLDSTGTPVRVTSSRMGDPALRQAPAGLAFGPDGSLFVGLKNGGTIYRLALVAGVETQRTAFGTFQGWANGLAFDSGGRLFVGLWSESGAARVVRLDADGLNPADVVIGGLFAGMAFGRGSLDCRDLYIADTSGPLRRVRTDNPGLPRP